jgi:hypothetical protein
VRSSPLPSSVGYTVATRGYSFREGQPPGPVIEGHADPIDDLLNDRGSLDSHGEYALNDATITSSMAPMCARIRVGATEQAKMS